MGKLWNNWSIQSAMRFKIHLNEFWGGVETFSMESSIKTLLRKNNSLEWTREIDFYFRKLGIVFFYSLLQETFQLEKKSLTR